MKRSDFIKKTVAGGLVLSATPLFRPWARAGEPVAPGAFPRGVLGRTGLEISLLGIGGWQMGTETLPQETADQIVQRAHELGINYIDTAPNYGNSEEKIGRALQGRRKDFIIATKTEEPGYDGTWRLLEQSLKRLQTDHIDIVNLHSFGNLKRFPDVAEILGPRGALAALEKAREQKLVRFFGATGHSAPTRFHQLLDSGRVDMLMNAVNFVVQHSYDFEHRVWNRAQQQNVGLVAMKVLGGGAEKPKGFRLPDDCYRQAICYALSLPGIAGMVIGMETVAELEKAAETVKTAAKLTDAEQMELYVRGFELLKADATWKTPYGGPMV
jgi:aryl-alcohol dehydrogenase-like predicted oxidoreductase